MSTPASPVLYTIGHSNGTLEDLISRLEAAEIRLLVDVRRFPGSRKWPHFSRDSLAVALPARGTAYRHVEALGGRRSVLPATVNTAWENPAFQGYADHMGTPEFQAAFDELLRWAAGERTAVMCSEVLWWRCHRSLIADAAVARGWRVIHLLPGKAEPHRLRDFARVTAEGRVIYPGTVAPAWI